jgi:ribosome maturation factor RimP
VEPREGRLRFQGTIEAVEGDRVRVRLEDGGTLELTVAEIAAAHLELDPWRRPEAARECREGEPES